jgi:hypothetical protein
MDELKSYVPNSSQLIEKMSKYSEKFEEAVKLIDNPKKPSSKDKSDKQGPESVNLWSFDLGIE